jgi:hypothetical protein
MLDFFRIRLMGRKINGLRCYRVLHPWCRS